LNEGKARLWYFKVNFFLMSIVEHEIALAHMQETSIKCWQSDNPSVLAEITFSLFIFFLRLEVAVGRELFDHNNNKLLL
jgi:hypothetical protein